MSTRHYLSGLIRSNAQAYRLLQPFDTYAAKRYLRLAIAYRSIFNKLAKP